MYEVLADVQTMVVILTTFLKSAASAPTITDVNIAAGLAGQELEGLRMILERQEAA